MKRLAILVLSLCCTVVVYGGVTLEQGYDMLVLDNWSFTQEEISGSLDSQRTVYESWLDIPGMYAKGQTGLFILDLYEAADTLEQAAYYQVEIIFDAMIEIMRAAYMAEMSLYAITDSVENQYDLIDNLYEYMSSGMDDTLTAWIRAIPGHMEERFYLTLEHAENTFEKLSVIGDTMGYKFDSIIASEEDFTFRVGRVEFYYDYYDQPHYDTSLVMTVYDESFISIDSAISYLEKAIRQLETGIEQTFDREYGNMELAIDAFTLSMQNFQGVCQSLNNYSIWSIIDSSWYINDSTEFSLTDIEAGFAEAEAMLEGKIYDLDGTPFRPVGILENLHYGLYQTYIDVYWQADPYTYTFRNILPSGAPADFIDHIKADMILDPRDTREQMTNYLTSLGFQYMTRLYSNPADVDANVGMGYIEMFAMIQDMVDQGNTIAALVDGGRIDSLFQNYDWTNLDYSDEIFYIRNYMGHHYGAMLDSNFVIYTILIKDPNRSAPGHIVQEGDMLYPVYVIPQVTEGIVQFSYIVENAVIAMKNGLEYVYTQVDSMIDITLDPNLLDLSDIEEPLDLIYALETSNPNFLAFTPEGKIKFAEFGDSLAVGMKYLADFADTVIATMEYAEALMYEFEMSEAEYDSMMSYMYYGNGMVHQMARDLAVPEAYTFMNGENVNMSAWFDDVPDNLLTVMKNYYEGTDSSMAGFFPDRMIQGGTEAEIIPAQFALKGNYPNPFNPLTNIAFDLPADNSVSMAVYSISGRKIADLIDSQPMPAGSYELSWNAGDLASGIYIVRMQYGNMSAYHKMTLLK
jgi:hypothetical protein